VLEGEVFATRTRFLNSTDNGGVGNRGASLLTEMRYIEELAQIVTHCMLDPLKSLIFLSCPIIEYEPLYFSIPHVTS